MLAAKFFPQDNDTTKSDDHKGQTDELGHPNIHKHQAVRPQFFNKEAAYSCLLYTS